VGKITDLLHTSQFQQGLVDGILALAVVLLCSMLRVFGRRPPIAGVAFAFAGLAALTGTGPGHRALDGVGIGALFGVVLLLAGGLGERFVPTPLRAIVGPVFLFPGSLVLGLAAHHHNAAWWSTALLIFGLPVFGTLAADFDNHHGRRAYGPILFVITVGGVYLTVPDTEGARALLGVALPMVLLTVPRPMATLGFGGSAAAVGVLMYDSTLEGIGRAGSIVGAVGCLGLFLYEPVGRVLLVRMRERDGHGPRDHYRNVAIAVVLHGAVVFWASRVAGRSEGAVAAFLLLLPAIAGGIIAAPLLPDPPLPRGATTAPR
jgi:hypothetical protein